MVHAALVAAGVRAARYVSPHLVDLAERFVIGTAPVSAGAVSWQKVVAAGARRMAQAKIKCFIRLSR